jgi:hypothetical protein
MNVVCPIAHEFVIIFTRMSGWVISRWQQVVEPSEKGSAVKKKFLNNYQLLAGTEHN